MEGTENQKKKRLILAQASIVFVAMLGVFCYLAVPALSAFNPQINYQGKLTNHSNVVVDNGQYEMVFKIYSVPTGGSALWTETRTGANKVTLYNGLFSVMLGEVTSLPTTSEFFNQTLYLEVAIGTSTPTVLSPRKKLGAVPAALYAKDSGTVGGVASTSILRSDIANARATITNLTSTNFFSQNISSTNATSTNFFASVINAVTGIINNLTATIANIATLAFGTATGNNLAVTNLNVTSTANVKNLNASSTVAINTTSTNLAVIGSSYFGGDVFLGSTTASADFNYIYNVDGNESGFKIRNLSTGTSATTEIQLWNDENQIGFIGHGSSNYNLIEYYTGGMAIGSLKDLYLVSESSSKIYFMNGLDSPTSAISGGKLGIGTTTPEYPLTVIGDGYLSGNLQVGRIMKVSDNTGNNNPFIILTSENSTSSFVVSGNFGNGSVDFGYIDDSLNILPVDFNFYGNLYTNSALSVSATSTFNGNIAVRAGLIDASGSLGTSGQILLSTGTSTLWSSTSSLGFLSVETDPYWMSASTSVAYLASNNIFLGTNEFLTINVSATSTFAGPVIFGGGGLTYDPVQNLTTIDNIQLGAINFEENAGLVSWIDMSVTSASATGTVHSYTAQLDGNPMFTIYGRSDGAGGINNLGVGIGTTSPMALFAVAGSSFLGGNVTTTGALSVSGLSTLASTTVTRLSVGTTSVASMVNIQALAGVSALNVASSTGASMFTVASNGNVGIRTYGLGIGLEILSEYTGDKVLFRAKSIEGANERGYLDIRDNAGHSTLLLYDRYGQNDVKFSTRDGEASWINNGGNFGIGTMSPVNPLTVVSSNISSSTLRLQSFRGAIGPTNILGGIDFSSNDTNLADPGVVTASILALANQTHTNLAWGTDLSFNVTNGTNISEALRIVGSGNVGIGTNNPLGRLDITNNNSTSSINTSNFPLVIKNTAWWVNQVTGIEFWNGTNKVVPTSRIISQMNGSGSGGENLFFQTQEPSGSNPNPNQPTTKLTITASGNIGIGTINPNTKLEVMGVASSTGLLVNGNGVVTGTLNIGNNTGVQSGIVLSVMGGAFGTDGSRFGDPTSSNPSPGMLWSFNSTEVGNPYGVGLGSLRNSKYDIWFQTGTVNGGGYRWYIGTNEKMTMDYLGNVGIGTTSPIAKLSVAGDTYIGGNLTATGTLTVLGDVTGANLNIANWNTAYNTVYASSTYWDTAYGWGNHALAGYLTSYTETDPIFMAASTSLPYQPIGSYLTVETDPIWSAASTSVGYLASNNTWTGLNTFATATATRLSVGTTSVASMFNIQASAGVSALNITSSTGASMFTVASNGKVGIGMTNPQSTLDVAGDVQVGNANGYRINLGQGNTKDWIMSRYDVTSLSKMFFRYSNVTGEDEEDGTRMTLDTSGNVGIGTTTPHERLTVSGNAYIGGNLTATGTLTVLGDVTGANLNIANWNTAYNTVNASSTYWDTAYGWGNHALAGYLTSYTETDPLFMAASTSLPYQPIGSYLTVESDPIWSAASTSIGYLASNNTWTGINTFNVTTTFGGRVGIGTTTPTAKLDIPVWSGIDRNVDKILAVGDQHYFVANVAYLHSLKSNNLAARYNNIPFVISQSYDQDLRLSNTGSGIINFYTNNLERVRIDNDGRVAIGTTSPTAMLQIQGTSTTPLLNVTASSSASALYVSNTGNVGIGTSSPQFKLEVDGIISSGSGVSSGEIRSYQANQYPSYYVSLKTDLGANKSGLYRSGLGLFAYYNTQTGGTFLDSMNGSFPVGFQINGVEKARLDSTGNFGIGTTSPIAKLSVSGNAYIGGNLTATGTLTVLGDVTGANLNIANWNTAYNTVYTSSTYWDTAYGWGNHALAGYLTSYTETDPIFMAASTSLPYQPIGSYLTVETDPYWMSASTSVGYLASNNTWTGLNTFNNATTTFSGNVGIGTTNPVNSLHINTGTGGGKGILLTGTQDTLRGWKISVGSSVESYPLIIARQYAGDLPVMTFDRGNGNVGIGTTSPIAKLAVAGNAYIGGNITATGTLTVLGDVTGANLNIANWNTAYNTVYASSTYWDTAYGWGNHASAGYLTSYTESDPLFMAASTSLPYQPIGSYLTVETDPIWSAASTSVGYLASNNTWTGLNAFATTTATRLSVGTTTAEGLLNLQAPTGVNPPLLTLSETTEGSWTAYLEHATGYLTWRRDDNKDALFSVRAGNNGLAGFYFRGAGERGGYFSNGNYNHFVELNGYYGNVHQYIYSTGGNNNVGIVMGASSGSYNSNRLTVLTASSTQGGILVRASSSQAANLLQIQNSASNNLFSISGTGLMSLGTTSVASMFNIQALAGVSALNIASSTGASMFTVASNGNVGIGTNSPARKLHVVGGGAITGNLGLGSGSPALYWKDDLRLGVSVDGITTTSFAERMRITSDGSVGIGTTSPIAKLAVAGNTYIGGNLTATGSAQFASLITTNASTTNLSISANAHLTGLTNSILATDATGKIVATTTTSGTVTSIAMTVPTGLTISGSPITSAGTLALGLDANYNIPLTASTTNWNTAFSWGNHALAGYLTSYTETDPIFMAASTSLPYQPIGSYLTVETDPIWTLASTSIGYLASNNTWTGLNTFNNATTTFSGRVGIGTTSPNTKLHIEGSTSGAGINQGLVYINANSGGSYDVAFGISDGANSLFSVKRSGEVLIDNALNIYNNGGHADLRMTPSGFNGVRIVGTANKILTLLDSSENIRMLVDSVGRIGVGTTSPTAMLQIQGTSTTPLLNVTASSSASALYVSNTGNVGIGTASPVDKLDVSGGISIHGDTGGGFGNSLRIYDENNTGSFRVYQEDISGNSLSRISSDGGISFTANGGYYVASASTYFNIGSGLNNAAYFNAGGLFNFRDVDASNITRLTIDSASGNLWTQGTIISTSTGSSYFVGNVGLGTTTPHERLTVSGNAYIGGNLTATGTLTVLGDVTGANLNISNWNTAYNTVYASSTYWDTAYGWGNHALAGYLTSYTETDPLFMAASTSLPYQPIGSYLTVESDPIWSAASTSIGYLASNNTWTGLNTFATTTATRLSVGTTSVASMLNIQALAGVSALNVASSTGASMFTVASNGNVGIGTTSPASKLHVYGGTATFHGNGSAPISWGNTTNLGALSYSGNDIILRSVITDADIIFQRNNTIETMRIDGNTGNVGIGTTSPSQDLDVVGNLQVTSQIHIGSDTSYGYISYESTPYNKTMYILGDNGVSLGTYNGGAQNWLNINDSGNVGLGITTPHERLTVSGNAYIGGNLTATGTLTVLGDVTGANLNISNWNTAYNTVYASSTYWDTAYGWGNHALAGYLTSYTESDPLFMAASTSLPYQPIGSYLTVETDPYWMSASTSVGYLASNNTWTGLNAFATTTAIRLSVGTTSVASMFNIQALAGVSALNITSSTGASMFTVASNGNVGIGTASPGVLLDLNQSGNGSKLRLEGPSLATFEMGLYAANANLGTVSNADLTFYTNNSDKMRLNKSGSLVLGSSFMGYDPGAGSMIISGNVGIGTTSPIAKLAVAGNAYIGGDLTATGTLTVLGNATIGSLNGLILGTNGLLSATSTLSSSYLSSNVMLENDNISLLYNDAGYLTSSTLSVAETDPYWMTASTSVGYLASNNTWTGINAFATTTAIRLSVGTTSVASMFNIQALAGVSALNITSSTGASMFTVASNGNVGIGISNPQSRLDVAVNGSDGVLDYNLRLHNFSNDGVRTTAGILFNTGYTDINRGKGGLVYENDTTLGWNRGNFHFLQRTDIGPGIARLSDSVMTIKNNGNVGIGTTTPSTKLDVWGNLNIATGTTPTLFVNTASGRVGIGTMSPTEKLQVNGNINLGVEDAKIYGNHGAKYLQLGNRAVLQAFDSVSLNEFHDGNYYTTLIATGGKIGIGTTTPSTRLDVWGNLNIATGTTPALFVSTASGRVGIGTNNPTQKLTVVGGLLLDDVGSSLQFNQTGTHNIKTGTAGANLNFTYWTGAIDASWMYLKDGGNVGIGTTSPIAKLSVAGDTYIGGNLTATGTLTVLGDVTGANLNIANWNTAYNTVYASSTYWDTAYGWGNHALAGYLTSYTESDPLFMAASTSLPYQPIGSYLTVETDPIWTAASTSYFHLANNNDILGNNTFSGINIFSATTTFNGRVGIGTSDPSVALEVIGTGKFDNIAVGNVSFTGTASYLGVSNNVRDWYFTGKSKSVTTEESAPSGVFFNPDGTKMYVIGTTGDDINTYILETPWDITTATYDSNRSVATQDSAPSDLWISPDGAKLYVLGGTGIDVNEYTLSTPWDMSTTGYITVFSVSAKESAPTGIHFKPDGTKMYITGSGSDSVHEYDLGTPFSVATAVFNQTYSVATYETAPSSLRFNAEGTKMYVMGSTGDDINEFRLSTPWDISTASYFATSFTFTGETVPTGLFVNDSTGKVYFIGTTLDTVYELATDSGVKFYGQSLLLDSQLYVDGRSEFNGEIYGNSAIRTPGTMYAAAFSGGSFSGTSIAGTSYVRSVPATLYASTDGLITYTSGASTGVTSSLVPLNISPRIRQSANAWDIDNGVNVNTNYWQEVISYPGDTVNSKLSWYQSNGAMATADEFQAPEIFNYYNNSFNALGSVYGSESLSNGSFTAPGGEWTTSLGWTLSGTTATYTRNATAGGQLVQPKDSLATPIKPNRWYRLTYTTSAHNTTVNVYIDPAGISQERVFLRSVNIATPGTWTTTFKTNSNPGDFILTAYGAAASDACTFDDLSLVEVQSGDFSASGLFTGGGASGIKVDELGNVGIGTTTPLAKLSVVGDSQFSGNLSVWGTSTMWGNLSVKAGLLDSIDSAGSAGQVLLSTGTSTLWVSTSSLGIIGGLTVETDPLFMAASTSLPYQPIGNYLTSYTETDPYWMTASSSYLTVATASSTYYRSTNPAGYISLSGISATSPIAYNNGTGVISVATNYSIPLTASTTNWQTAYSWGNWASNFGTGAGTIAQGNDSRINNGQTAYGWGNHASAGYLTSFTESDPIFMAASTSLPYQPIGNYLTSYTETDPYWMTASSSYLTVATASSTYYRSTNPAGYISLSGISATSPIAYNNGTGVISVATNYEIPLTASTTNWQTAYSWGNWASNFGTGAGTIAQGNDSRINNGQTAYGWGNHASAGYLTSFTESDPIFMAASTSLPYQPIGNYLTSYTETDPYWMTASSSYLTVATASSTYYRSTNPAGYITSSALTPYLTTTTASETYYPLTNPAGYTNNTGTVTSVAMTVPTGLTISGSPITGAGTLALGLNANYNIPLTVSTTNWTSAYNTVTANSANWTSAYNIIVASSSNWQTFYNTPSTRITPGAGLDWSGNTLILTGGGSGDSFWSDTGTILSPATSTRGLTVNGETNLVSLNVSGLTSLATTSISDNLTISGGELGLWSTGSLVGGIFESQITTSSYVSILGALGANGIGLVGAGSTTGNFAYGKGVGSISVGEEYGSYAFTGNGGIAGLFVAPEDGIDFVSPTNYNYFRDVAQLLGPIGILSMSSSTGAVLYGKDLGLASAGEVGIFSAGTKLGGIFLGGTDIYQNPIGIVEEFFPDNDSVALGVFGADIGLAVGTDNPDSMAIFSMGGYNYFEGSIGIGATSSDYKLAVLGDVGILGTVTASCFSTDGVNCITGEGEAESDPIFMAASTSLPYQPIGNYLTSYTETDPIWMTASSSYLTVLTASSTYYRSTNPAGYISLSGISATSPIAYNNGTGVISVATNYSIPLTASTTNWESFYNNPATRITPGAGLDWSGNTLILTGGGGGDSLWSDTGTALTPVTSTRGLTISGSTSLATTTITGGLGISVGTTTGLTVTSNFVGGTFQGDFMGLVSQSNWTGAYINGGSIGLASVGGNIGGFFNSNPEIGLEEIDASTNIGVISFGSSTGIMSHGQSSGIVGLSPRIGGIFGADPNLASDGFSTSTLFDITDILSGNDTFFNLLTASEVTLGSFNLGGIGSWSKGGIGAISAGVLAGSIIDGRQIGAIITSGNFERSLVDIATSSDLEYYSSAVESLTSVLGDGIGLVVLASSTGIYSSGADFGTITTGDKVAVMGSTFDYNGTGVGGIFTSGAGALTFDPFNLPPEWQGSALVAISSSTGLFVSALDPGGYAIKSTDGLNFFSGTTSIGTTSTQNKLNVAGNINIIGDSAYRLNNKNMISGSTTLNSYFFADAGNTSSTGSWNMGFGQQVLSANTTGANNVGIGGKSLMSNITGYSNVAIGSSALYRNTTGFNNVAVGLEAMYNNLSGANNIAFGYRALYNGSSTGNTVFGFQAGYGTTTSESAFNQLFGYQAGFRLQTGSNNNLFGYQAGFNLTTGSDNSFLGNKAGFSLTTGSDNIFLGNSAGYNLTSGSGNILIGKNVQATSTGSSNFLNIGDALYGNLTTGNIGIGTTNPTVKLAVVGDANVSGTITASCFTTDGITCITGGGGGGDTGSYWSDNGVVLMPATSTRGLTISGKTTLVNVSTTNISISGDTYLNNLANTALATDANGKIIATSTARFLTTSTAATTYLSLSNWYATSTKFLTTTTAASTYQPIGNYLTTSTGLTVSNFASANISQWTNNSGYITASALTPYLTTTTAASTYLTQATAASTYLSLSNWYATSTKFLTTTTAASTYLTQASAASTYQPLGNYLTTSTGLTVSNFASANISQWTNNSGYITASALTPYLTTTTAASTYLTQATAASTYLSLSNWYTTSTKFLTTTTAASTYLSLFNWYTTSTKFLTTTTAASTYYPSTNPAGYTTNTGTVTSVAMTVPTGLTISGSPITGAGTLALNLHANHNIPLTASTTNWNNAYNTVTANSANWTSAYNIIVASSSNWQTFYNTPSSRIELGAGLAWNGNILSATGGGGGGGDSLWYDTGTAISPVTSTRGLTINGTTNLATTTITGGLGVTGILQIGGGYVGLIANGDQVGVAGNAPWVGGLFESQSPSVDYEIIFEDLGIQNQGIALTGFGSSTGAILHGNQYGLVASSAGLAVYAQGNSMFEGNLTVSGTTTASCFSLDGVTCLTSGGSGPSGTTTLGYGTMIGDVNDYLEFDYYTVGTGLLTGTQIPVINSYGNFFIDDEGTPVNAGSFLFGFGTYGSVIAFPTGGDGNPSFAFWDPDIGFPGANIMYGYYDDGEVLDDKSLNFLGASQYNFDNRLSVIFDEDAGGTGITLKNLSDGTSATAEISMHNDLGQVGSLFTTGSNFSALGSGFENSMGFVTLPGSNMVIGNFGDDAIIFLNDMTPAVTITQGYMQLASLTSDGAVYSYGGLLTNVNPSSREYKNTIEPIQLDVDALLGLQVKSFNWNNNGQADFGLIAEEIRDVLPELYSDNGMNKGYRADHLPFYLLQIAQNHNTSIKAMGEQLRAVSSSISSIDSNLSVQSINNNFSSLSVSSAASFYGTITVVGEAGFESKVTFKNDVEIEGKLYLDKDQVGTVVLLAGTTTVEVIFDKPFKSIPKVLLNLNLSTSSIFARYAVSQKSTSSFTIIIDQPVAEDLSFDWVALGQREIPVTDQDISVEDSASSSDFELIMAEIDNTSSTDAQTTPPANNDAGSTTTEPIVEASSEETDTSNEVEPEPEPEQPVPVVADPEPVDDPAPEVVE